MVSSVGARFILVRAECPYFQYSVARATGTLLLNACSRGYKRAREGRFPKSLWGSVAKDSMYRRLLPTIVIVVVLRSAFDRLSGRCRPSPFIDQGGSQLQVASRGRSYCVMVE
jgi:hypothetical protein